MIACKFKIKTTYLDDDSLAVVQFTLAQIFCP